MSLDPFDDWLTTHPDDVEVCEVHGYAVSCPICRLEYLEAVEDGKREEGT